MASSVKCRPKRAPSPDSAERVNSFNNCANSSFVMPLSFAPAELDSTCKQSDARMESPPQTWRHHGLVPVIHVLFAQKKEKKRWMAGSTPAMTRTGVMPVSNAQFEIYESPGLFRGL